MSSGQLFLIRQGLVTMTCVLINEATSLNEGMTSGELPNWESKKSIGVLGAVGF